MKVYRKLYEACEANDWRLGLFSTEKEHRLEVREAAALGVVGELLACGVADTVEEAAIAAATSLMTQGHISA